MIFYMIFFDSKSTNNNDFHFVNDNHERKLKTNISENNF